jgi:hypothetical protein
MAVGPVVLPKRLTLASEAFSHAIEYLIPDAKRRYLDLPQDQLIPLVESCYIGDPPADALIVAIRSSRGRARRQFDQALHHGIESVDDPLPAVRDFFAGVDRVPDWIDDELVAVGVRAARRIDGVTQAGLGYALGFLLAAILPNSAESMASNARSVQNAGRRFEETGKIVIDMMHPDGRGRFGAGTRSSTQLRLLHAAVRARLQQRGAWDESVQGVPISAMDTLGASLVNSATFLAAERSGYRFSSREWSGIAHFSALFAYRQGVPADLIPRTIDEQTRAFYFFLRSARGLAAGESTERLMPGLVDIDIPTLPALARPVLRVVYRAYGRQVFGPELSDATGITDTPARHLIPILSLGIAPFELLRSRSDRLDRMTHRLADVAWAKVMPRLYSDSADYDSAHIAAIVAS